MNTPSVGAEESADLRLLVRKIKDLPTVPTVLMKLLSLSADSTANADNLALIIGIDQTISAKLLRLANSAFYGCRGKVVSIPRAIMVLGFTEVKSLALGMSVFNSFSTKADGKGISIEKLWKHSIAVAAVSKFMASKVSGAKVDSYFTGGLLHDIGKVVFLHSFREEYRKVAEIIERERCRIDQAEQKVFNITHTTIGEWLCRKWQMPEEITQCVKCHLNPDEADEENMRFVSIIYLANLITRRALPGYGGDDMTPACQEGVLERLNLDEKDIKEVEAFVEKEKESIEQMI